MLGEDITFWEVRANNVTSPRYNYQMRVVPLQDLRGFLVWKGKGGGESIYVCMTAALIMGWCHVRHHGRHYHPRGPIVAGM